VFNADDFRAAHRPWEFVVDGRRFVAQPVSTPAVLAFHAAVRGRSPERALRALLRRAFPWRPSYWWFGDPVQLLLRLEPAAQREALADFFGHLEGKPTSPLPTKIPQTPGTSSPAITPAPTG